MVIKKMSAIAHKKTKPVAIKRPALKKTDQYIGTCRSYDEQQPIPSFVRSLTPKNNSDETATQDSCPDISEKDKEESPAFDTQKVGHLRCWKGKISAEKIHCIFENG